MPTALVVVLVVAAAAALFGLAWWSSGRSGRLARRNAAGDAGQDAARLQANINKTHRGTDFGGSGGGSFHP